MFFYTLPITGTKLNNNEFDLRQRPVKEPVYVMKKLPNEDEPNQEDDAASGDDRVCAVCDKAFAYRGHMLHHKCKGPSNYMDIVNFANQYATDLVESGGVGIFQVTKVSEPISIEFTLPAGIESTDVGFDPGWAKRLSSPYLSRL